MRYSPKALINKAIMVNKPLVVVEGKDDVQVYDGLLELMPNKQLNVKSIDEIRGYQPGCNGVMQLFLDLKSEGVFEQRNDDKNAYRYFLGIVDRDLTPYQTGTNATNNLNTYQGRGIHVLKYYSMETYFVNTKVTKEVIKYCTSIRKDLIADSTVELVMQNFKDVERELYYLSLEALRDELDPTYTGVVGLNKKDDLKKEKTRAYLYHQLDTDRLDAYAQNKGISITNLKQICKGKWYFSVYISRICHAIGSLKEKCNNNELEKQCGACAAGNEQSCSYQTKASFKQTNHVEIKAKEVFCSAEFGDVLQAFGNLAGLVLP